MDSIFEKQRNSHEAIERLENLASSLMVDNPHSHRARLARAHRVSRLTDKIVEFSRELFQCYEDLSNTRQTEFDSIACHEGDFAEFYSRLDDIREFHQGNDGEQVEPMEISFMGSDPAAEDRRLLETLFSGEENGGKYLGLHENHQYYVNIPGAPKIGYISYLERLKDSIAGANLLERITRLSLEYKSYLEALINYFIGFIYRTDPCFDLDQFKIELENNFVLTWNERVGLGWDKEILKQKPENSKLFCSICNKQYNKDQIYERHFNEKRHKRAEAAVIAGVKVKSFEEISLEKQVELEEKYKTISRLENYVAGYCKRLDRELTATIESSERKQTLTEAELLDEQAEETAEAVAVSSGRMGHTDNTNSDDDSESDDRIYNPLRLPLGWDGKPIPYWLYKLHGLGVEYSCEICGNYVYMGRKAYERHFQEWRHAHGMRCLGIPNTRHFYEINLIEDAQSLFSKLKSSQRNLGFRPEDEEFEDNEGNVYNRKTYEDLLRQGLL